MKYNTYMLGDVCTFIDYRGKTPPKTSSGIPLITAKIIKNNVIQEPKEFIDESFYDEWMRRGIPKKGDVVFTTEAPLGEVARITSDSKMAFAQRVIILEPNEDILDAGYLFYALQDRLLKNRILARSSGTTVFGIKSKELKKVEIDLPCLEIQRKISNVLLAIDEKISINNLINDNLQEQAQALYTNMFIQNYSNQWAEGVLSDVAEIIMGQSPKGNTYNEDGVGTVFFQGRGEFGFRFPTRRLFTTDPKRMAQSNDVLMSVRAPVGDLNVAYEPCCIGRGLGAIRSINNHQSFVLYTVFSLRGKLDMFNGEGTVFGSINRDALNSMPIVIPTKKEMDRFEGIVAPMDAAIRNNYEEICHLEAIRDSLLPRLISGELDVSDIDL